ncbi:hypothetical protein [Mammaliicoccus sciuri]|uniref:hypothetical protein n=1 Tax=Mammaliicoccus sciuri TaxID=1296 RepID=UPI00178056EE|nr:hypothetical protein [Mammaliicoccus sciuri]
MKYIIPPSLYIILGIAYFKGSVKVKDSYKHFDLIIKDKLLDRHMESMEIIEKRNFIMPIVKYSETLESNEEGKKVFLTITYTLLATLIPIIIPIWAIF